MSVTDLADFVPTRADMERLFHLKFGDPQTTGWGPRLRHRLDYFSPDDYYEAVVDKLVTEDTSWIDVGSGRNVFPSNPALAKTLADRCKLLFGLDPDDTLNENEFVHERAQSMIEDFETDQTFDLVTMRMVAEHIAKPDEAVQALKRLTHPGGKVVIYTVNKWSPVPVISNLVPFRLHHPIKKILWGGEEKDTFPTVYRMNTRKSLARLFQAQGLRERHFSYLDDCRSTQRFRALQYVEIVTSKALRKVGLRYPENCLLGVYERE